MEGLRARLWQTGPGAAATHYVPAHVQYLVLFSPELTKHLDAEDPARLAGQVLFYTDQHAVSQVETVRQVALANALIKLTTSLAPDAHTDRRVLAVGTTCRRLYLIEVAPDLWLHAAHRGDHAEPRPWCDDAWMQQQLLDAWLAWRGAPHTLWHRDGREALERSLERFFSKWVWQWDVEHQCAPVLHASQPASVRCGLLAEACGTLDAVPDVHEDDLVQALAWFSRASAQMSSEAPVDMLLLYDDQVLWPQPHTPHTSSLDAQVRRQIARYVLRRLVGLEGARREAATVAATRATPRPSPPEPMASLDTAPRAWYADVPLMSDMGSGAPFWLDAWWPKSQSATAGPDAAPHENTNADAESSAPWHAFHARLQHAMGDDAAEHTARPSPDTAVSQLQEITQAYAATRVAAPASRRRSAKKPAEPATRSSPPKQHAALGVGVVPHDVRLDGWGAETPVPWHHATLHVGGPDTVPLTDERGVQDNDTVHVVYTTRQLLTVVLVWPSGATDEAAQAAWLAPAWELLRRVQRCLNDKQRKARASDTSELPAFVHIDTSSALCWRQLPVSLSPGLEAQLRTSQAWLAQHGITESFARAENHSFWVTARKARDGASHTFMVLQGTAQRGYGMGVCDYEMRRLSARYSV